MIKGLKTFLMAAALAACTFLQSDAVAQLLKENPGAVSTALFAFIAFLRVISTGPAFEALKKLFDSSESDK